MPKPEEAPSIPLDRSGQGQEGNYMQQEYARMMEKGPEDVPHCGQCDAPGVMMEVEGDNKLMEERPFCPKGHGEIPVHEKEAAA